MADSDHVFQKLCHEAVLACGPDVGAVERYLIERLGTLDEAGRARVRRDIDRVLAFRAPPAMPGEPH